MSDALGLTDVQRAVLHLLYAARGHAGVVDLPTGTAAALVDLEERGLVWQGPGRGWWLTGDGQAVVEADI